MRVKDALSKANITTVEGMEKKKTIAQILDEALEQEFPEEKVEHIGKNYNETAKQEDVRYIPLSCISLCKASVDSGWLMTAMRTLNPLNLFLASNALPLAQQSPISNFVAYCT